MLKIKFIFEKFLNLESILKKNNIFFIFCVLLSFLGGNIFGLNSKNFLFIQPETLFFVFPLLIEFLNIFIYKLKRKYTKNFYLTIISIRRGFLLGIFLEAFKLGS
uniref:Hypothetical chloroplast RF20 n=1 Tax=Dicloster acuatus TaxID=91190 RepID=A0A097KQH9_9CHLO|nr:hypothetical chloroplast RF20 [Dicloster acuatus]AIT95459.1 hypothetical chloroplast RF20 [Dicloster acuatus]